jgi:hypothetical protein
MSDCFDSGFNRRGNIAIVVGSNSKFTTIEFDKNSTNPEKLIFKRI